MHGRLDKEQLVKEEKFFSIRYLIYLASLSGRLSYLHVLVANEADG